MKKRPLGQNFLVDRHVAGQIVELAGIDPGDLVLEIGPGGGVLTEGLLEKAETVVALEIDPGLCDGLRKRFGSHPKFRLLQADALKFDYALLGPRYKVVSNLPYYAATHILKRLIHYGSRISAMTLMLQKEVVDRLMADPGCKEYGSLTVFFQYHCGAERLLEVGRNCFSPPPKVESSVIQATPRARPPVEVENEQTFFKIVNAAFLHKRKMLRSNLRAWEKQFDVDRDKVQLAGIDLSRRGETLSLEDFAAISNLVHSING